MIKLTKITNSKSFHLTLLFSLTIFWVFMAIAPVDRHDWVVENILFFVVIAVGVLTYRVFTFCDLSYFLIFLFLILHQIGAHYTYSQVPCGFWVQDWLGLERNHFDRLVHFSFGLLLVYPIRELLVRMTNLKGFLSFYLPVDIILAFSGLFEIIEWLVASIVNPELGAAYLGTQGDIWDAQKDMLMATFGALLVMVFMWIRDGFKRKKWYESMIC
jgi:putative membrane protein